MVVLIKFISLLIYPLGLVLLLFLTGILLHFLKRTRISASLFIAGFLVLLFFSSPVVANFLGRILEKKYSQQLPDRNCSAIVVLGGGGVPLIPPRTYPEINEAGDRLLHAARLYKMGLAPIIITTGGDPGTALYKSISEAQENAMILRETGVDSSSIIMEHKARNTHEHAEYIAKILDSLHVKRSIILVTSAAHMIRSVGVFEKYGGYSIYPAPADFNAEEGLFTRITDFFPSAGALERSTIVMHEYYGILGYKILGYFN